MEPRDHIQRAAQLMNDVYEDTDDPDPRLADAATHLQVAGVQDVLTDAEDSIDAMDDSTADDTDHAEATGGSVESEDEATTDGGTTTRPASSVDVARLDVETRDRPTGIDVSRISDRDRTRQAGAISPDTSAHHLLGVLVDNGEPMTNAELAELTGLPRGTISGGLSTLYRYTYVDRDGIGEFPASGGQEVLAYYPTEWGEERLDVLDRKMDGEREGVSTDD